MKPNRELFPVFRIASHGVGCCGAAVDSKKIECSIDEKRKILADEIRGAAHTVPGRRESAPAPPPVAAPRARRRSRPVAAAGLRGPDSGPGRDRDATDRILAVENLGTREHEHATKRIFVCTSDFYVRVSVATRFAVP